MRCEEEKAVYANIMKEFEKWFKIYQTKKLWSKSFILGTFFDGQPDARIMAVSELRENGFVFCTSSLGKKAKDMGMVKVLLFSFFAF